MEIHSCTSLQIWYRSDMTDGLICNRGTENRVSSVHPAVSVPEAAIPVPVPEAAALITGLKAVLPVPEAAALITGPKAVLPVPVSEAAALITGSEAADLVMGPKAAALIPGSKNAALVI